MYKNSKVLAIKYRPQVFEDLIGQNEIVETIYNAIKLKKTPNLKKKSDTNEHLIGDFIDEYNDVGLILKKNKKKISEAVNLFTKTFTKNGSIYFIGAGTSGRLGVLEAAECPPTFGTQPDRIVGLMAGGRSAVFKSKEGAL